MSVSAVLEAREQRWQAKQALARRWRACVLSLCLNIPGPDKNPPGVEQAFALLQTALREAHARELRRLHRNQTRRPALLQGGRASVKHKQAPLARLPKKPCLVLKKSRSGSCAAILHEVQGKGADGPHWLMASPLPGLVLKRMAVRLEREHPLGRLADIDILTATGEPVSRADLTLPPRSCFLCEQAATLCRQKKTHSQERLMRFIALLLEKVGGH
jgi:holo-ACP synthase